MYWCILQLGDTTGHSRMSMVTYNPTDGRRDEAGTSCAHCHSGNPHEGDVSHSSSGSWCCSAACAALVDEAAERAALPAIVCTNCERPCASSAVIEFSEDGLPFCSDTCAVSYPAPV